MKTDTDTATHNNSLRERASGAYGTARERASGAYGTARETASSATNKTAEQISANPVGAILGGFALGAVIAAVLPKTQREVETFGDMGHKLTDAARDAARSAADAGREQIDEITGNAVTQVGSAVVDALKSSTNQQ